MFYKIVLRRPAKIGIKPEGKSMLHIRASVDNYFHINAKKASFVGGQGFTFKSYRAFEVRTLGNMTIQCQRFWKHTFAVWRNYDK